MPDEKISTQQTPAIGVVTAEGEWWLWFTPSCLYTSRKSVITRGCQAEKEERTVESKSMAGVKEEV